MDTGTTLEHDWFPRPLPANVVVGDRSWIYSAFAFVHYLASQPSAVRIGHDTGIYNGTFFDLGPDAQVQIGDFCTLVGAILRTDGRVAIGDYSFIAHEVVFADSTGAIPPALPEVESSCAQAPEAAKRTRVSATRESHARPAQPAPILLGENCWVGMGAVLLSGTDLGEGCVVGAGAVVDFAAPPYSIIAGNPARIVGTAR